MSDIRAIVALSEVEAADFFPGPMWSELGQLLPGYRRVQLPLSQPEEWVRLWRETPADLLVSAWQTPSLNGPLEPDDVKSLRYVCYLAGSVRKLVPRELVHQGLIVTNWGDTIAATVAEFIQVEGMDAADRELLAFGLVGMSEGASRHWIATGGFAEPDHLAGTVAELAWAGLRGSGPQS